MRSVHRAALAAVTPREIEPGFWVAELDGYPGVWADGATEAACRATLAEVLAGWLALKRAHGDGDIPGEERVP